MKKRKFTRKITVKLIVVASFFVFALSALIVTNIFIPVKYFFAYVHFNKDYPDAGEMRVRYIDVGYGDCTLVELPDGKTMLIDGGTSTYSNVHNLLSVLNKSGIGTIDYLICTSVKGEHCGSLAEIVKYKTVKTAYIPYVENTFITEEYAAFYNNLLDNGVTEIQFAEYGKGVKSGEWGYFFCFLSPAAYTLDGSGYAVMNRLPTSANISGASAVLWLEYAGKGLMFLSDAHASVQSKIADSLYIENKSYSLEGEALTLSACAVLKVANHGGADSTCASLYDLISPQASIISVGQNAHSAPSVTEIANLQLYVCDNFYRTDLHGTVTVRVTQDSYSISKEK